MIKILLRAKEGATRLLSNMDIAEDAVDVVNFNGIQLGEGGVSKFKNMFAALEAGDYAEGCEQMLDSKWHMQTPNRCE